jgi:hypothetical protein
MAFASSTEDSGLGSARLPGHVACTFELSGSARCNGEHKAPKRNGAGVTDVPLVTTPSISGPDILPFSYFPRPPSRVGSAAVSAPCTTLSGCPRPILQISNRAERVSLVWLAMLRDRDISRARSRGPSGGGPARRSQAADRRRPGSRARSVTNELLGGDH